MVSKVDFPEYPPAELLPDDAAKAVAARDAAADRLSKFEDEHRDVLADNWAAIAEAKDVQAAIAATRAGKDALSGASESTKAREARPRLIGIQRALTADLQRAQAEARKAIQRTAAELEPTLRAELEDTARAAESAYRAYLDARGAFGGVAARLRAVRLWAIREHAAWHTGEASPARTDGRPLKATNPLREIREVVESCDMPMVGVTDPMVVVERSDGTTFHLRETQARALLSDGNSEHTLKIVGFVE